MSYTFTDNTVWGVDAVGIVTHKPVVLRSAVFYPDAIGDSVTFKTWHPQGELGTTEHTVLDSYKNPPLTGAMIKGGRTLYAPKNETYNATASVTGTSAFEDPATGGTFFTEAKVGTPPSIMRLLYSSGDSDNYRTGAGPGGKGLGGYLLIVTRDSNDKITVATGAGALTDEASKVYSWWIITEDSNLDQAFVIKALKTSGSDTIVQGAVMYDFNESGKWFPNLACTSLSSSASIDLYVK